MKRIVLCVAVLFFGLVKPKAQELSLSSVTSFNKGFRNVPGTAFLFNKNRTGASSAASLPIDLINFHGCVKKSRVTLEWAIARNEVAERFEVESSSNGKDFKTTGLVFTSEKSGNEDYSFFENARYKRIYYRLKLIDKSQVSGYSKILVFHLDEEAGSRSASNPPVVNC